MKVQLVRTLLRLSCIASSGFPSPNFVVIYKSDLFNPLCRMAVATPSSLSYPLEKKIRKGRTPDLEIEDYIEQCRYGWTLCLKLVWCIHECQCLCAHFRFHKRSMESRTSLRLWVLQRWSVDDEPPPCFHHWVPYRRMAWLCNQEIVCLKVLAMRIYGTPVEIWAWTFEPRRCKFVWQA